MSGVNDRRDDEGTPPDHALLDAWEAAEPTPGFADRVLAARNAPRVLTSTARTPRRRTMVAPSLAAAAAAALAFGVSRWPEAPSEGVQETAGTVEIGRRAVAVARSGAQLRWSVERGGATTVMQDAGSVFYRVEKGSAFNVRTPAGEVTVQGTCFHIDVDSKGISAMTTKNGSAGKLVMSAAAGAAMAAAVLVTVYEGRVAFANSRGERVLGAGESAVAERGEAPRLVEGRVRALEDERRTLATQRDELRAQVAELDGQIKALMIGQSKGENLADTEVRTLREQLKAAREALAAERNEEERRAGESVPWPELAEAYQQEGLRKSFLDAIRNADLQGDIKSIDCTEFPCVVYGDAVLPGDKISAETRMKAFENALHAQYPEKQHSMHQSVWSKSEKGATGETQQRALFGMSVYPQGTIDDDARKKVQKRLRYRHQQYMDSVMEAQ